MPKIDYDKLAKEHGAVATTVDYDALAKKAGALSSGKALHLADPSRKLDAPTSVSPGMPTSVQEMGSADPASSKAARIISGLVEAVPALATGAPAWFVSAIATPGNAIINSLKGSEKPWSDAVRDVDELLSHVTYQPKTKEGQYVTKGLTYGIIASTAPYLLPFLGLGEALDTETAKTMLTDEQIAKLKVANNLIMLGGPALEAYSKSPHYEAMKSKIEKIGEPKPKEKFSKTQYPPSALHPDLYEKYKENKTLTPEMKAQLQPGGKLYLEDKSEIPLSSEEQSEVEKGNISTPFAEKDSFLSDDGSMKKWADLTEKERSYYFDPSKEVPRGTPDQLHIEKVSDKADSVFGEDKQAGPYKKRGLFGRVIDKLNITPLKRTQRVSPETADVMAEHAASYGQGNRVVNWLISKVHPDAFEHLPKHLQEYMVEGPDGMVTLKAGPITLKRTLSAREYQLLTEAVIRNNFGRILIKDRIVGIYKSSLNRVEIAKHTIADMGEHLKSLSDQHRRLTSGKGASSDVRILPDLEKNIQELQEAISKAKADEKYYSEKASNITKSHDVETYSKHVRNNMGQFEKELSAWKEHVNPYLDSLLKESKGIEEGGHLDTDNTGYHTGARINLVHSDALSPEWEAGTVLKNRADASAKENLAKDTGKSITKDPWDREAKGTGTYTTSLYGMLRPVVSKRLQSVTKLRLYNQLEKSGLGKVIGVGEAVPTEVNGRPMVNLGAIEMPHTVDGKTTTALKHLYVGEDISPEVKQLFLDDKDISEIPGAKALTTLQLSQIATDAFAHGTNQLTLVNKFFSNEMSRIATKIPLLSPAEATTRFFKTAKAIFDNSPEIIERQKNMGERGLLRDGYHVSWLAEKMAKLTGRPGMVDLASGQILMKLDTATRMLLDDHFTMMVEKGLAKDTPTNRRNFISQVGNYNARLMEKWMSDLRRIGASPFVVAGATFNRNALRFGTGHPGFETTGLAASIKLRSEHLVKPILFGLTIPAMWNMYKVGHPLGRPGTPPGHLDMGGQADENGKFDTFNMMALTPFDRFMRMTGGQALWEGAHSGKTATQISGQAGMDALRSQKHVVWGPGIEGLFVAATGRDTDFEGRPHVRAKSTLPEKLLERGRAALEVTSPQFHAAITGENAGGKLGAYAEDKVESPLAKRALNIADLALKAPKRTLGIDQSHMARTAAEQEIVDRRAYLNDATEADTKETRRILKTGIDMAKKNEADGIKYLYDALDKRKIGKEQFEKAWEERETPSIVKDFKKMGVKKTTTEKGSYAALYVYRLMNEKEKALTTDMLNKKIEDAWGKADAAQQREMLKKWHEILPEVFGNVE